MNLIFLGDSLTDMDRNREKEGTPASYGVGFVRDAANMLIKENPMKYKIYNRGVSGDKTVDIYARLKRDVWSLNPDVLTVLVGINDLAFDVKLGVGVEPARYEKVYDCILSETAERFPHVKFILVKPFFLHGTQTDEWYEGFCRLNEYTAAVERLSEKYSAEIVDVQNKFNSAAATYGNEAVLFDGVHANVFGCGVLAEEWYKAFLRIEKK